MVVAKKPAAVKKTPAATSVENPLDTSSPIEGSGADTGAGLPAPGMDDGHSKQEGQEPASGVGNAGNLSAASLSGDNATSNEAPTGHCVFKVKSPLSHNGQDYSQNQLILLNAEAEGAALEALNVVERLTDDDEITSDQIIIAAKEDGVACAGRTWSRESIMLPMDEFTEEQLDALLAEPMLDVAFIAKGVK